MAENFGVFCIMIEYNAKHLQLDGNQLDLIGRSDFFSPRTKSPGMARRHFFLAALAAQIYKSAVETHDISAHPSSIEQKRQYTIIFWRIGRILEAQALESILFSQTISTIETHLAQEIYILSFELDRLIFDD